jgi:hypothetical protein
MLWAKDNSNGYPVVRWTSPADGGYRLACTFTGADERGVDVLVYVVVDESIRASGHIQAYQDSVVFSLEDLDLQSGDHVDFLIAWNGGVYSEYNWTKVTGTIEPATTSVAESSSSMPGMLLSRSHPNPGRGAVNVSLIMRARGEAHLRVYDVAGRFVETVFTGVLPAGVHPFRWQPDDHPRSGVYFFDAEALGMRQTERFIVIR